VPSQVRVTVLADRDFASTRLYHYIERDLHWDYIIRFRKNTYAWVLNQVFISLWPMVASNGKISEWADVGITRKRALVPAIVYTKRQGMSDLAL
jgi:hypothetical protein